MKEKKASEADIERYIHSLTTHAKVFQTYQNAYLQELLKYNPVLAWLQE